MWPQIATVEVNHVMLCPLNLEQFWTQKRLNFKDQVNVENVQLEHEQPPYHSDENVKFCTTKKCGFLMHFCRFSLLL